MRRLIPAVMMWQLYGTGRKSGIWQGSTEVELQQLERQWDDYKVTHSQSHAHAPLNEVCINTRNMRTFGCCFRLANMHLQIQ